MPRSRTLLLVCGLLVLAACRPRRVCHVDNDEHQGEQFPPEDDLEPRPQDFARFEGPVLITLGECPADTAEPTEYFLGAVRLPLPKGVDANNFFELTPTLTRNAGVIESTNCREGWPSGNIDFLALAEFEEVPGKPRDQLRIELLQAFGYPPGTVPIEGGEQRPGLWLWVHEVPPTAERPEPAKMLLAAHVSHDRLFVLVYECHPNAWPVLVNTFVDSATRASFPAPSPTP